MAAFLRNLVGGTQKPVAPSQSRDDGDFADFAHAPPPAPVSASPSIPSAVSNSAAYPTSSGFRAPVVYTKWYRVWERTTPQDFYNEGFILIVIVILGLAHFWGTKRNRRVAKEWLAVTIPSLQSEFSQVGFGGRNFPSVDDVDSMGLAKASISDHLDIPVESYREKSPFEFVTYATGRQNIAFLHLTISLYKRYNPVIWFAETAAGFLLESMPTPAETLRLTAYPFNGKEKDLVPVPGGVQGQEILEARGRSTQSAYDDFVWAIVNKDGMKALRDDRYDISLTTTKDNFKLPAWATLMSESAEVSDLLLTPDLIKAIETVGDDFEYVIVTDQPLEKPTTLEETRPRKRIDLSLKVRSSNKKAVESLVSLFIRLPDQLASSAHFRPEVLRKVRQTREEEIHKIERASKDGKAGERSTKREKDKKEKRENTLKGLSADEQRKFLERERKKEIKKSQKPR